MNDNTIYTKVEIVRTCKVEEKKLTPYYLRVKTYDQCKLQVSGSFLIIITDEKGDKTKHKVIPLEGVDEFYLYI